MSSTYFHAGPKCEGATCRHPDHDATAGGHVCACGDLFERPQEFSRGTCDRCVEFEHIECSHRDGEACLFDADDHSGRKVRP